MKTTQGGDFETNLNRTRSSKGSRSGIQDASDRVNYHRGLSSAEQAALLSPGSRSSLSNVSSDGSLLNLICVTHEKPNESTNVSIQYLEDEVPDSNDDTYFPHPIEKKQESDPNLLDASLGCQSSSKKHRKKANGTSSALLNSQNN